MVQDLVSGGLGHRAIGSDGGHGGVVPAPELCRRFWRRFRQPADLGDGHTSVRLEKWPPRSEPGFESHDVDGTFRPDEIEAVVRERQRSHVSLKARDPRESLGASGPACQVFQERRMAVHRHDVRLRERSGQRERLSSGTAADIEYPSAVREAGQLLRRFPGRSVGTRAFSGQVRVQLPEETQRPGPLIRREWDDRRRRMGRRPPPRAAAPAPGRSPREPAWRGFPCHISTCLKTVPSTGCGPRGSESRRRLATSSAIGPSS